jgi:membrane protease YdiL (CAAX protease family)
MSAFAALLMTGLFCWWYLWRNPEEGSRIRSRLPGGGWRSLAVAVAATTILHIAVLILFSTIPSITRTRSFAAPDDWRSPEGFVRQFAEFAILIPVIEEIGFRGWFVRALEVHVRKPVAAVISGIVFSLLHLQVVGIPLRLVLGFLFATVMYRTRSIWSAIALHALGNAIVMISGVTGFPVDFLPESMPVPERRAVAMVAAGLGAGMIALVAFGTYGRSSATEAVPDDIRRTAS